MKTQMNIVLRDCLFCKRKTKHKKNGSDLKCLTCLRHHVGREELNMAYGENLSDEQWLLQKLEEPGLERGIKLRVSQYLHRIAFGNADAGVAHFRLAYPLKNPPALNERT